MSVLTAERPSPQEMYAEDRWTDMRTVMAWGPPGHLCSCTPTQYILGQLRMMSGWGPNALNEDCDLQGPGLSQLPGLAGNLDLI
jgi:hypothetical protein